MINTYFEMPHDKNRILTFKICTWFINIGHMWSHKMSLNNLKEMKSYGICSSIMEIN